MGAAYNWSTVERWEGIGCDEHKPGDLPVFFTKAYADRRGLRQNTYFILIHSASPPY